MLSTLSEEMLSWLAVERGRRLNTLAAYRRDLSAFEQWLAARGVAGPAEAGTALIAEYISHLRQRGLAPASVARAMVAVRSLYRFMAEEGEAGPGAAVDLRPPPVPAGLPKALSEEEVGRLLSAVTGNEALPRRDRAVLELLYGTGMRISELTGLSLPDVMVEDQLVRVLGKGGKERLVPLGRHARAALGDWLAPGGRALLVRERAPRRADSDALFLNHRGGRLSRQGAWGVVSRYGRLVGLQGRLAPHVLRHSCATHMLDHGADLRVVQELLGHASIATTQVYTKVSTDRLRQAYESAHPRARKSS